MLNFKKTLFLLPVFFCFSAVVSAENILSNDEKLSCEAILCLATSKRPSECDPSIAEYRSIKKKRMRDTINARRNFLALCPKGKTTPLLESLLDAQSVAEQFCDADKLNAADDPRLVRDENGLDSGLANRGCGAGMWCAGEAPPPISNVLPAQCAALANHPYTYEALPKYVGTPGVDGRWVSTDTYESMNIKK